MNNNGHSDGGFALTDIAHTAYCMHLALGLLEEDKCHMPWIYPAWRLARDPFLVDAMILAWQL